MTRSFRLKFDSVISDVTILSDTAVFDIVHYMHKEKQKLNL